jgi:hypothetical protein
MNRFFPIYVIFSAVQGQEVYSGSNRNGYKKQIFLGSRVRPACMANNFTAICEPIVQTMWDP